MKSIPPAPAMNCESEYHESNEKEENLFVRKMSFDVAKTSPVDANKRRIDVSKTSSVIKLQKKGKNVFTFSFKASDKNSSASEEDSQHIDLSPEANRLPHQLFLDSAEQDFGQIVKVSN